MLSEEELVRFTAKIEYTDKCWLWRGQVDKDGYGRFRISTKKRVQAHRLALEQSLGRELLPGMVAAHALHSVCGNRNCVNPAHLREATQADNMNDMRLDGIRRARLAPDVVLKIRADTRTARAIATDYHLTEADIRSIKTYKVWKNVTPTAVVEEVH